MKKIDEEGEGPGNVMGPVESPNIAGTSLPINGVSRRKKPETENTFARVKSLIANKAKIK